MNGDNWSVDPPVPRAAPRMPSTPAKEYYKPEVSKVSVALDADEDCFVPSPLARDGSAPLTANIPGGGVDIPKGGSVVVDCGFSIKLPVGYRCRVSSVVPGVLIDIVDCKRFKVNAVNLGDETKLNDREEIGRLWVEPVYFVEWITRG